MKKSEFEEKVRILRESQKCLDFERKSVCDDFFHSGEDHKHMDPEIEAQAGDQGEFSNRNSPEVQQQLIWRAEQ